LKKRCRKSRDSRLLITRAQAIFTFSLPASEAPCDFLFSNAFYGLARK